MRRREDFTLTARRGRRAARPTLVVHMLVDDTDAIPESRVGFVVGRSVGGSVVRHRVSRRLRHLVADRLPRLPRASLTVVRALPPAAGASASDLAADLDAALERVLPVPAA
jgi:ribonuclease P protein component